MMLEKEWDPLKDDDQIPEELVSAAKKRQIKNILKSYVGLYDPFAELIQNAMDAVDIRSAIEGESYQKYIWIEVNLQNNTFSVTDNGIGFNDQEYKSFLTPNISFKNGDKTRGNKGVGATYLAYGFNYLQLGTKNQKQSIVKEICGGREWVEDEKGVITRPLVKDSVIHHSAFKSIDKGSSFTIHFGGINTRPKNISWFNANKAEQWLYILLLKTPLGNIDILKVHQKPTLFTINVYDEQGIETKVENKTANYIYPNDAITSTLDIKEVLSYQQLALQKGKDPGQLPDKFKNLNGVYEVFNKEEIKQITNCTPEQAELLSRYNICAYGFFCYSVRIWDQFNDTVAKLRKGTRILKGGLQLANNHMPQGDLITIPLTQNIGYQNQSHVIVHFTDADPDYGRKGFQPELKELSEEMSVAIVTRLKRWRKLLKKDTGVSPKIKDEGKVYDWLKDQEQHEKSSPLTIQNKNFFIPIREISITSTPQSEQDVIVLFNQLIAGGVIRGIKLLATDSHKQYDGVFKYYISEPLENHVYEQDKNPLGVEKHSHEDAYLSKPYVLEYKYNFDALVQEFENGEKNESDINLVVAWEMGELWKKRYNVISLLDIDNLQHRSFHGQTHIITDDVTGQQRFYCVILSELVGFLNDPINEIQRQKQVYGDIV